MRLRELAERIRRAGPPARIETKIVAVDGLGGAGKTTLADRLATELGARVVRTDEFASWDNPVDWWPRLLAEVLEPISRNETARYRPTSWGDGLEDWREVEPSGIVILEGVTASRDVFRPFLTYAIWVETPRRLRLARGLERDGDAARPQWDRWMAAEDAYMERERPHERADAVLRGDEVLED
jgi:uridine kinase